MKNIPAIILVLYSLTSNAQTDPSQWERNADTGRSASWLTDYEKDILLELNKARTDPARYAELYIAPMVNEFSGNINKRTNIQTREGVSAVKECIAQMRKARPIGVLNANEKLEGTASYHTDAQSRTREVGHTSPDGKTFADRLKPLRFPTAGECISYGENKARGVVTSLLIDDGVSDRGHRKTILNGQFDAVGIAEGSHKVFGYMCTIDFAGGTPRSR